MGRKAITLFLVFVICFALVGCSKTENNKTDKKVKESNKVKTILSCHKDFTLFHSKQHLENKIYLDKNNKLIDYEYTESYYEFDSDNEYTRTCEGLVGEAENNTKIYDYLTQTANCDSNKHEVSYTSKYDMSKVTSKGKLEGKNMKEYLDDNFILDLENYKNAVSGKGYTCE